MRAGSREPVLWVFVVVLLGGALFFDPGAAASSGDRSTGCELHAEAPISHGPRTGDRYSLTFDEPLGPRTRRILDILGRFGARATFFVVGEQARTHPGLLREIQAQGHELANHSLTHRRFDGLDADERRHELEATDQVIVRRTGFRPCLFRPPHGAYDAPILRQAERLGLTTILWDVYAAEWAYGSDEIASRVLAETQAGSIVLFHQVPSVIAALPAVLDGLAERGLRSVRVTSLLGGAFVGG